MGCRVLSAAFAVASLTGTVLLCAAMLLVCADIPPDGGAAAGPAAGYLQAGRATTNSSK
jgi:hypothetical protein